MPAQICRIHSKKAKTVWVGAYDSHPEAEGYSSFMRVEKVIVHPEYDKNTFENDVAVLKLSGAAVSKKGEDTVANIDTASFRITWRMAHTRRPPKTHGMLLSALVVCIVVCRDLKILLP